METAILVVAIFLLWKSRNLIGLIIDKTTYVSEDSLSTYANEVSILNAKKRAEQAKDIQAIDIKLSNKDIEDLLNGLNKTKEEA